MTRTIRTFEPGTRVRALIGQRGEVWGRVVSQTHDQVRIKATHKADFLGGTRKRTSGEYNVLADYTKSVEEA